MSRKNKKESAPRAESFAKKYLPAVAALIIAAAAAALLFLFGNGGSSAPSATFAADADGLYVHYIDVGQGDSELICCGGEYMLVDAGVPEAGETVVAYLEELGIEELDYVVCTHGHADHCGGLDEIVDAFEVETVFTSPYAGDGGSYEYFVRAAQERGLTPEVPDSGVEYRLGGASFEFIGPLSDHENLNDDSLVFRLEYGGTSFLFTGDMTSEGEKELIESGAELKCDVLKVGHHGSRSSSSYRFLYETEPGIAVISCAADNEYGHPHEETLSRLEDEGAAVYRTDLEGSIVIFSDGSSVGRAA